MIQVSGRDTGPVSIIQLHPGYVADDADTVQTLVSSGGGVQPLQHPRVTMSGLHLNHHLPFDLHSVRRSGDKGLKQKFSGTNL